MLSVWPLVSNFPISRMNLIGLAGNFKKNYL
jgi:hypothetical protein